MMGFSQSHNNNNNNNNLSSTYSNSHPLVSSIITFFLLILLYFPHLFSTFLFSPILFLTGILLLSLLRLGATQRFSNDDHDNINETKVEEIEKNDDVLIETGSQDKANCTVLCFEEAFVEWNVRAPLEVIYEEDNDKDVLNETQTCTDTLFRHVGIERYPSLSLYYPETDSENSSDDEFPTPGNWDSLDNVCFMWNDDDDDDEEKDELIEISLDKNCKKLVSEFQFEEENLIEIDISSMRNEEDFYR